MRLFKMELFIDAVYCFFVIINVFNILGQKYYEKLVFYFLLVIQSLSSLSFRKLVVTLNMA